MNFIQCSRDGKVLSTTDFNYELSDTRFRRWDPQPISYSVSGQKNVVFVLNPTEPNDIAVKVDVVEPFGSENNFYFVPETRRSDNTIIATVGGPTKIADRLALGMRVPEEHICLFDGEYETVLRHPTAEEQELSPVVG